MFGAFAAGIKNKKLTTEEVTVKSLRSKVADFLLSSKGEVPGMLYAQFIELPNGSIVTDESSFRRIRNSRDAPITLQKYADKIRKYL
jgi:hypothetical protein